MEYCLSSKMNELWYMPESLEHYTKWKKPNRKDKTLLVVWNSQKIKLQWLKTSYWLLQDQWEGKEGLAIKVYIENILEKL